MVVNQMKHSLSKLCMRQKKEILDRLYHVDVLDGPLPTASRTKPAGKYDEILGIEYFYDYLENVHSNATGMNANDLPFKPSILTLRENLNRIERFKEFADRSENQWFNKGKFADFFKYCQQILDTRDRIVQMQLAMQFPKDSREYLISRGIAAYLSHEGKKQDELKQEIEQSFTALKRKVLNLNKEFNLAMPEEAVKVRWKIISTGIPGDAIVKKMWGQRPSSGWSKANE